MLNQGDTVQVIAGTWKGCIGYLAYTVGNGEKVTMWSVNLHRDTTVVLSERDIQRLEPDTEDLPVEFRDAQVAVVDFHLGAKRAALELLKSQVAELEAIREECENDGIYEKSKRVRLG